MHQRIFQEFESILANRSVGSRVLEIGAVPTSHSLLNLSSVRGARERVGVNLDGGRSYRLGENLPDPGFPILEANANNLDCFADSHFDTVLCNSVLEHDRFFWRTLAEIRRVSRPGALVVIATPGYDDLENIRLDQVTPEQKQQLRRRIQQLVWGTVTLPIHDWPGDYYRFSPQAYREVILEGMSDIEVYSIMLPPRVVGIGYNAKPA